jgi:hypothetical protein
MGQFSKLTEGFDQTKNSWVACVLSEVDKAVIETRVGAWRKVFRGKGWSSEHRIIKIIKITETGSTTRKYGSGRPRTVTTVENKSYMLKIVSQEDNPGSHKSKWQIASNLNVGRASVQRMAGDLGLKSLQED